MVRRWVASPPGWLSVRTPTVAPDAELIAAELDAGEFDAIRLAQELGATDLIVDDWQGRQEAERRHIHYIGTVGVLKLAARKGFVDLKAALLRLRDTNFHISQGLIDQILGNTKS
jgi:predicted nucleic acid-binding protein